MIAASATDARDAFVIADAARTLPHTLRRVGPDEQAVAALGVLAGYDADLASEATRQTNQLHDACCSGQNNCLGSEGTPMAITVRSAGSRLGAGVTSAE